MGKQAHICPVCRKEVKGGDSPRVVQTLKIYTPTLFEVIVGWFHIECWDNCNPDPPKEAAEVAGTH